MDQNKIRLTAFNVHPLHKIHRNPSTGLAYKTCGRADSHRDITSPLANNHRQVRSKGFQI
jgi:hypothetical protein